MTTRGSWWVGSRVAESGSGRFTQAPRMRSAVEQLTGAVWDTVCQLQSELPALSCRAVGEPGHPPKQ